MLPNFPLPIPSPRPRLRQPALPVPSWALAAHPFCFHLSTLASSVPDQQHSYCPAPLPLLASLLSSSKRPPPANHVTLALHSHCSPCPLSLQSSGFSIPSNSPRLLGTLCPHCPSQLPCYISPPPTPPVSPPLRSSGHSPFPPAPAPSFLLLHSGCPLPSELRLRPSRSR